MELANVIAGSRDFPECRSPEKAAVRIMAGREMGIGPIASVIGIRINAGRVSMDSQLMAGAIKRSGRYDYIVKDHTAQGCSLEFRENGQLAGVSEFSMTDAEKAGLAKKDTWRAYPRNMLFARALSNGARWFCPGIFGGAVYTHEELGYSIDDEGRAVDTGAGSDLCTREQRQTIADLATAAGLVMTDLLTAQGVRMLDELSGYEADKLIKSLTKKSEKAARKAASTEPGPSKEGTAPAAEASVSQPQEPAVGPAQQMLVEAFATIEKCSVEQRDRILMLAESLEPDENELPFMMEAILAKRGVKKILELTQAQAGELIQAMEAQLGAPFDPGQQVAVQATVR